LTISPIERGAAYLQFAAQFLPEPDMIDVMQNLRDRDCICTGIGQQIDPINQMLQQHLLACHDCFHLPDRQPMQIFAVPLAQGYGLEGFCNIWTTPKTILVDVGRVVPADWLNLVVHEYAHAHLGDGGHHTAYAEVLTHLCLGLGLAAPPWLDADRSTINGLWLEAQLQHHPPSTPTSDPLAFWCGLAADTVLEWGII
jgi:hypothetical protein